MLVKEGGNAYYQAFNFANARVVSTRGGQLPVPQAHRGVHFLSVLSAWSWAWATPCLPGQPPFRARCPLQPITAVQINGERLKHGTSNWWEWNPGNVSQAAAAGTLTARQHCCPAGPSMHTHACCPLPAPRLASLRLPSGCLPARTSPCPPSGYRPAWSFQHRAAGQQQGGASREGHVSAPAAPLPLRSVHARIPCRAGCRAHRLHARNHTSMCLSAPANEALAGARRPLQQAEEPGARRSVWPRGFRPVSAAPLSTGGLY